MSNVEQYPGPSKGHPEKNQKPEEKKVRTEQEKEPPAPEPDDSATKPSRKPI